MADDGSMSSHMQRITLVGYRASGKTTIARALAQRLRWPWVDVDEMIVRVAGAPIPDLFAQYGEGGFRDWESRCLGLAFAENPPQIIATGGGIVERSQNRSMLSKPEAGMVCYLEAPVQVLQQRLRQHCGDRPSLSGNQHPADELPPILARRDPWYRAVADCMVDATQPQEAVVEEIIRSFYD